MLKELRKKIEQEGSLSIKVRIHPGAKKSVFKEVMTDGVIKIDICAVPEKGKANKALLRFFAKEFGFPEDSFKIISGQSGRNKLIKIKKI
jgi:hypothetical protein